MPDVPELEPWDRPAGALVVAIVTCASAGALFGYALADDTGGAWLPAGLALLAAGLCLGNLLHVRARRDRTGPLRPPPGRPYDWTREPDPDAVISLTRGRRRVSRGERPWLDPIDQLPWPCTMDGPGDPPPCGTVCDTCPIPGPLPVDPPA
jgi:hypothetical protein